MSDHSIDTTAPAMATAPASPKTRTITLTDRPPVTIREDQWPCIAEAIDDQDEGEIKIQSNRTRDWWIRVRQHVDGRALVYAYNSYSTAWQGEQGYCRRTGELLPAGTSTDLIAAIRRVGRDLPADLVQECIADLPAEEL